MIVIFAEISEEHGQIKKIVKDMFYVIQYTPLWVAYSNCAKLLLEHNGANIFTI